jgi:pimeloyl-ACP methyl ester carboxylesterase
MGLGAPRGLWPDVFCDRLAARGFRVITLDNRDVGESTWIDGAEAPDMVRAAVQRVRKRPPPAPYAVEDMADDVVGLLDALSIPSAHVVGASMGGMIGQVLAFAHAGRVRSLTSIMSATGQLRYFLASPPILWKVTRPPPDDPAAQVDHSVDVLRAIWGRTLPFEEDRIRDQMARFRGGPNPVGVTRQVAAIIASGDRTGQLRAIHRPTLVVHGTDDPLIPLAGGRATAAAIPGAELLIIPGMGHGLPRPAWDSIIDGIVRTSARVEPN